MARPLRIEYPGALYHVTSCGDRHEAIFDDDQDRTAFLNFLGEVISRFRWRCHTYCLMGNHYHLMIETPQGNLTRRYKAILVNRDSYFLELARYIVLNPVRAAMVTHPRQWQWSSYGATSGRAAAPAWLTTDDLLAREPSGSGLE